MQELDYNAAKKLGMNAILLNRQVYVGKKAWLCTWLSSCYFLLQGKVSALSTSICTASNLTTAIERIACTQQQRQNFVLVIGIPSNARLAQSVEHQTFNLRAKGSSPLSGVLKFSFFLFFCPTMSFLSSQKVSQTNSFYKKYITI